MQYESTQYRPGIIFLGLLKVMVIFDRYLDFEEDFSNFRAPEYIEPFVFFREFLKRKICAYEDSDQKAYPPSLARFFIVHLMVSFLHMGNKDSDQARPWLRLSLVFAGRIGHFFDLRKHYWEICCLPPIIATAPSITFYSQFLCRACNDIMIYSFTQCS